jgi:hypothetical protein
MHREWKVALLVLALIVTSVGMTACAKYPVVTNTPYSSPSAAAPVSHPTR